MPVIPGHPILESELTALGDAAAALTGGSYTFEAYGSPSERRWLTQLSLLFQEVFAAGVDRICTAIYPARTSWMDPAAGCVSGPWIVPWGHPWFFDISNTPRLTGVFGGDNVSGGYNLGRTALDCALWSKGEATPFRVCAFGFPPIFDFQLATPDDDENGYQGGAESGGTATWSYPRASYTQGSFSLVGYWTAVSSSGAAYISLAGSTAGYTLEESWRTVSDPYEKDGQTVYDVVAAYFVFWGTCINPEGNRDLFERGTGPLGTSFTFQWAASADGKCYFPADGQPNGNGFFYADSLYTGGSQAASISRELWYLTRESVAFGVQRNVRSHGITGTPTTAFSNTVALFAEALPSNPSAPAETHWQAKLWPVTGRSRGGAVLTFPGQALAGAGQTVAVPWNAADGLWCQPVGEAEWEMDGTTRYQPGPWSPLSLSGMVAIDYVQITRKKPYGAMPAVDVDIGCWRGAEGSRTFSTVLTVTLPASETHARIDLVTLTGFENLLPLFGNVSIGYQSDGDLVTVRLGNWKPITAPSGSPWTVGLVSADGTPAGIYNDLEAFIEAATPPA